MPQHDKKYRIFISAAEPSADAHCAGLINALKRSDYSIEFVGVGGPKMAAAGCRLLQNITDRASMGYNAFTHIAYFYKLIKRITRFLKSNSIDLVIVCDSPAFNFHVAKAAKKAKIKTLFYVAPQLWCWAGWRIRKLRKYCDKLACILPFEQDWFSRRGVDTAFVGNPLFDNLSIDLTGHRRKYADFRPENAGFAIMPGSRTAEINALWRPMQTIAIRLKQKYPNASFTTVAVDADRQKALKSAEIAGFNCKYTIDAVCDTARTADFAIVASGSSTLQVAAVGCPMVIMYQSSRILWRLIGSWLIKTKYLSLVNILAGRELVPEFMPYFSSIEPVVRAIELFLEDIGRLTRTADDLLKLTSPLSAKSACDETAKIVIDPLS